MDLALQGKVAVVTGASKGIGLAAAHAYAAEGCHIVLAARDPARLEAAAAEVRSRHQVRVETIACDLAKAADRDRLAQAHASADILVNNAGAIPAGSVLDLSMERWQEAWQLKVFGYVHLSQHFLRAMKERGSGTIVNIIGMAGQAPRWDYVCGAAGNAALIAFTRAVGAKSVDFGVRVFGINPAATRTDRIVTLSKTKAQAKFQDEERWAEMLGRMPFGRLKEPSEVAALAVMLSAPSVAYLSGTVIDMDGGGQYYGG